MRDLEQLGGTSSYATAINSSGVVVGVFQAANGSSHVFMSAPNGGTLRDLGIGDGSPRINDRGEIVAGKRLYTPGYGWSNVEDLLHTSVSLPSFTSFGVEYYGLTSADAINDLSQITGVFWSDYRNQAFVISPVPRLEIEKMPVLALSGPTQTILKDAKASAGAYTSVSTTTPGQYVTYSIPVPAVGTYRVKVGVQTGAGQVPACRQRR